jgi:hypothetical protein
VWSFGRQDEERFSVPVLVGLYGLLFSPGKGLVLYAPVILVPVLCLRTLYAKGRSEVLLLLAVSLVYLVLYGSWYDWYGGLCWGPRFLLPLIGPWLALAGRAVRPPSRRTVSVGLGITAGLGLAVQAVGASVHPHWINLVPGLDPFNWSNSHLINTLKTLLSRGPDDFWLQALGEGPSAYVVLAAGLALLALVALVSVWVLARQRPISAV